MVQNLSKITCNNCVSFEVKYKEFHKTTFQKFDSSRQDSFIHWYKLFCSTCLQWGLWCPLMSQSKKIIFMDAGGIASLPQSIAKRHSWHHLSMLSCRWNRSSPPTKEHGIVHGCPANAGYDALSGSCAFTTPVCSLPCRLSMKSSPTSCRDLQQLPPTSS
jgi:hypothetical protein